MFDRISFAGLKSSTQFGYAAEVPFFKGRRHLDFKPGLNILFGPNGCGKSTVLRMLAGTMCAAQGGISTVTETAIRENVDMLANIGRASRSTTPPKHTVGLKIVHDGQPVAYCDPRNRVGLAGGTFDDDFLRQGLAEKLSVGRHSHGEAALSRASTVLGMLIGTIDFPSSIEYKVSRRAMNSQWTAALDVLEAAMAAQRPVGQRSVLLDEPEANYSLVWQARLWDLLARESVANDFQLIVASHSPYALGIRHANYIDFEDGYRSEAEALLRERFRG